MKLSVLLIAYNQERFIGQAIESALAQRTNFDYEVVIGDDGSTDRTASIVTDFHRLHPDRIVPILRPRNIGGLRNFEMTLEACRGKYVALLEGDDYWISSDKLQRQVDFLDAHPDCAISCHRVRVLRDDERAATELYPELPAGRYAIEDLLKGNFVMTCSAVLRRDLTLSLPASLSGVKAGDWARFVLAAKHGSIELMDDAMAAYRRHASGVWSSQPPVVRCQEAIRTLMLLDRHLDFAYANTVRQALAFFFLQIALMSRLEGKRAETIRNVASCIRNGGWRSGNRRTLASLMAFALTGFRRDYFSKATSGQAQR